MKKLLNLINQKKARRVVAIAMLFSLSFSMITSGSLILYAEPNQVENTDLENNSTDNNSANLSSSELGETPDFTDLVNQMISGGSDEQGSDEQGSDEQGSDEQGSDEQGSDEQGSDEQGSDEQGSDEQGSDEQSSDEQSSDEQDSDEQSSDEQGSDEQDSDEQGSDEQGSDEQGSDEQDSDEQGSDEQGSDEQGSDEQGSDEQGSDEQGSDEQGSDEQGSDEQGSDEQGSDEQGSDEQGSDEQGSDEQGSDEQGSDEQGSDEQGSDELFIDAPVSLTMLGSTGLMLSSHSEDIEPDYSLTQLVVNAYASYFVDVLYAENPFVSERDINITSDNTKTLSSALEDIFAYNTYTDKYVISGIPTTEVHPLQSVVDTLGADWETVLVNFINEVYKYNYGDDDTDLETRKAAIHLNYGVDGDYTSMPYDEFKTYFVNALVKALNKKITETTTTVNNKLKLNLRTNVSEFTNVSILYINPDDNSLFVNNIPNNQDYYYMDNQNEYFTNGLEFLVLYQKDDITDFKADITSNYISSLFCAYLSCMSTANPLYIELYQDGYNFEILYKNEQSIVSKAYVSETGIFVTDPVTNTIVKTTPIRFEDIFNRNTSKPTDVIIKVINNNNIVAITTGEILYQEIQAIYDAIETNASVYAKKQEDGSYVVEYSDHVVPLHWFAGVVDDDTALSMAILQGNPDLQYIDITEYNHDKLIPGSDISEYITSVNYDFNKPVITFTYALPTSSRYYTTQNVVPERFLSAIRVAITDYYPYIAESAFDDTQYNVNDFYYVSDLGIYVAKDASQKLTKEEYESAGCPANYISEWYVLSYDNTSDSFATCDLTSPFTKPVFNTTSQMWEGSITLDLTECLPLGNYEITITGVPTFNYTQGSATFSATDYRDVTVVSTDKIVVSGVPSTTSAGDITVKFDIVDENNVASTSKYNFYLGDVVIATNANSANVKISNNGNFVVTAKDTTTGYTISASFVVSCFNNMPTQTAIISGPTGGIGGMNLHWIDAIADTLVQTGMNGVALITMGIFFFVCGAIILLSKYYTKRRFTSVLSVLLVISLAIPYNLGELFAQEHIKYDSNYTSQSPHLINDSYGTVNTQDHTFHDLNEKDSINLSNSGSGSVSFSTFYNGAKTADFREYITGFATKTGVNAVAIDAMTTQNVKDIYTSGRYWFTLAYATTGSFVQTSTIAEFRPGSGQDTSLKLDNANLHYSDSDAVFDNNFVKWLLINWNKGIASNGYNASKYTIDGGWANTLGYYQLHSNGVTSINNATLNGFATDSTFMNKVSTFLKDDSNPINKTDYQTKYSNFTNRISLTPDYETMKYYFNGASNEVTKDTPQSYYESRIETQQHNIYKYKERTGSSSGSTIDDPSSAPTVGGTYSRVDRNSDTYTYDYTETKQHKELKTTTYTYNWGTHSYSASNSYETVAWTATAPANTVAHHEGETYYHYSISTITDSTTTVTNANSVPTDYTSGNYHYSYSTNATHTHTHYTVYGWNSYSDYQYADMGTGSLADTVSYGANAYQRSYTTLAATRYTWSYSGINKVATHQQYTYNFHADALTKDNTDAILNPALKPTDDSDATALDAWDAVYGNASGAYKTYDADLSYNSGSDEGFDLGGFRRKTNISANTNNSANGIITDVTYGSASASDAVSLGAADLKSKVDAIIDTHTSSINTAHSTQETNILNNWAKPSYWNNILPVHYTNLSDSYNQVYDVNSAGCADATWPSRTQFIDFMTNDSDEIKTMRNKLYSIFTQRAGCEAYTKCVKTFINDTLVNGTSNYATAGLTATQQFPAPMYLSIIIALNGASNSAYLYGNISDSGYLKTALYRDDYLLAGFEWYSKIAYKLANNTQKSTGPVQESGSLVRNLDDNKISGSTITGTNVSDQIVISKKPSGTNDVSGLFIGQDATNNRYNLHYMNSAFVVTQGSNSALAYCWSAGQVAPNFSNLGTALTIANGSTNNTKQYIYLVAEVDPHTGTPLRVAGSGQSTVRDMLGVLYSALGEADNAPKNILNRTNVNGTGSSVGLKVDTNPAATESYYMEHMMGTLINKTADHNSDVSQIHGNVDNKTLSVNEQFNTLLRFHTILTLKGEHNRANLLEKGNTAHWYDTNGGYELLYYDENDHNSGVIGIKQGNNKYYMYVYKESSTAQSIVFLVKDTPLQNALEVNGNVTETFDPETLVAEGGSKVTQFKPSKGDNGTVNYNAGPTATTLNKCGIGTDEFDYTQETTKQTTPDTTGYNLYSTGVASGIVNQNNASTITYKNLKSGLYTNATSTNVKGATTNANNSRGIVIAEPAISNQAPVNIGNYLVLDVNASLYAKAAMEQFGLFDSYTLYTERNNSSVKGIKDPIDGLSVAFSLNGKVNFQSTYLYTGLDYSTNAHKVNIVRNSDTLLKDVAERRVNVGSEIYIKEHTVKSYLYHIDVQYNIDDNNTISTNTIVTTKVITGGDSAIDQKEYNVQNNNTIFRVDGELTTWACNLENDAANTAYVNEIKSILTNNDFNSIEDISNALGNRPKVVGDEICVGYNRAGRTDYTVNDTNNGGAGQFRGFTIVTIAFTKPSITQSSGELWLHEEELNFWYGNMIEASNNTIEWRLKKFQSIAQDVSVIADTVNGMVVERQVINPQAYGTYDGALLYSKGLQLPNATSSVNYAKLNWTPLTPQYYTYPTNIINSTTQDYSFTVYNGIDTHLVISDLTSGYSKNLDDVAPGYYYDEAFNVYDGTGLFAGYRYNRDNNVGRYLYDTTRVMSRSGLRASAYDIYVLDADTSRLGTLITYSFNQVRAFNGDTRNVSALSVGQAPGNVNNYTLNGHTFNLLDYNTNILKTTIGHMWSGYSGTLADKSGLKYINAPYTETVKMKAVNPYTGTTLRYDTEIKTEFQQIDSKNYAQLKDVTRSPQQWFDAVRYTQFYPFTLMTKGNNMYSANNQHSTLVVHNVNNYAYKYTSQDVTKGVFKVKTYDGHNYSLGDTNGTDIYSISVSDAITGVGHYSSYAQVKSNRATITYLPEVIMTTVYKEPITKANGPELFYAATLTMAEKYRKTQQGSLYIMAMKGDHIKGVTYSNASMGGVKGNTGADKNYTYVANGGDFTLKIDNDSVLASLYGYSLDIIDVNKDTTYTMPQNTYNASTGEVHEGSVVTLNYEKLITQPKDGTTNQYRDIRGDWGNNSTAKNADALKNDFIAWANDFMKPDNFGVDANLTLGMEGSGTGDDLVINASDSGLDYIDHYTGFSGSLGTVSSSTNAEAEYVFPLCVADGQLVKDTSYQRMICQIALDYSTPDFTCTYSQAETLFDNSGMKQAILASIESTNSTFNKSQKYRDKEYGALNAQGTWHYNGNLSDEITLRYGEDHWYDEKVKSIVVRRFKWENWHFNDINISDKIDINETAWGTTQLDKNGSGATGKWYLNVFFLDNVNSSLNFADDELYSPNGIYNTSAGFRAKGTLTQAHNAGSVVICNAYVHDWSTNMRSDFKVSAGTSVNDFDE